MGWKNFKEHFGIEHIVSVVGTELRIGSPYILSLIVVDMQTGLIAKPYDRGNNDALDRHHREIAADPAKVLELLVAPDSFSSSIPVFTYDGSDIIEGLCEELGWPNLTHDGTLMYENTFTPTREEAVALAKKSVTGAIEYRKSHLDECRALVAKTAERLAQSEEILSKLNSEYPD